METAVGDEGGFVLVSKELKMVLKLSLLRLKLLDMFQVKTYLSDLTVLHQNSTIKNVKVYDYTKFEGEGAAVRTSAEQIDYLEELVNKYPIITIEDGMDENDWDGWKALTERLGKKSTTCW